MRPINTAAGRQAAWIRLLVSACTSVLVVPLARAEDSGIVSVPLIVQEILPSGTSGFDRTAAGATFGMPFPDGQVPILNERPALGITGPSARWQFRTLETWPSGYVKWVLVDVQADVPANSLNTALTIIPGPGQSGQAALASETAAFITLDTGPGGLIAQISKNDFDVFHQVWVDGVEIVPAGESLGIVGTDPAGLLIVPKPGTVTVVIEENGPARAVVRADGTLHTLTGVDLLDFTCRLIAHAGSKDVQVDFTVRNANINRPQHVAVDSVNLVVHVKTGGNATAQISRHDNGIETIPLASGDYAYLHQAQSSAYTYNAVDVMYGQDGYEIVKTINNIPTMLWPLGDKTKYPKHAYAELTGDNGGVTMSYRFMPFQAPASLELSGSGDVVAGLFSSRHTPGKVWTFNWRQHESRTAVFSFHRAAEPPALVAMALDLPVAGRAADYLQYDRAGVLPYRLVTIAQQNQAYAAMGLNYSAGTQNDLQTVMRWLYAAQGGGFNNHDSIERRLGGEWLRQGHGGQYLTALDLALYKSEWQILRSDNFLDINDPGAANPALKKNGGYEGDFSHRYRDGIILAYYLTGDERLRDALFDEAEILNHYVDSPYDRPMYSTFRAVTRVAEFTGDPDGLLRAKLKSSLQYFCNKLLNINTTLYNGWGWEALPDQGSRRYYTNNVGFTNVGPPDYYFNRGFFAASLGPIAFYHAARWLGLSDPVGALARGRMRDLAFYARNELYPYQPNPFDRWLVYDYGVNTQTAYTLEYSDAHPLSLGLGEAFLDSGDDSYLEKAVEQLQAAAVHENALSEMGSRLDVQHFIRIYLDYLQPSTPPPGPTLQFYGTATPSCIGSSVIGVGPALQSNPGFVAITVSKAPPNSAGFLLLSTASASKSIKGATVLVDVSPNAASLAIPVASTAGGYAEFAVDPATVLPSGLARYAQYVFKNTACGSPSTWSASNGLSIIQP